MGAEKMMPLSVISLFLGPRDDCAKPATCQQKYRHLMEVNCRALQTLVVARANNLRVANKTEETPVVMTTSERLKRLEMVAMHSEGAHYALHDLVAAMLARAPEADARSMIQTLADQVSVHADKIGEIRLAGYTQELDSIRHEVEHARGGAQGLFARLTRSKI